MKYYRCAKKILKPLYYGSMSCFLMMLAVLMVKQQLETVHRIDHSPPRKFFARALESDKEDINSRAINDNEAEQSEIIKKPKQTPKLKYVENTPQSYWDKEIQTKIFSEEMPNPNFVFHNKLPKSGSSTMNNILKMLSHELGYGFEKIEVGNLTTHNSGAIIDYIDEITDDKFLLLKHHQYFDFTAFGREQPTFINVMRDPLEWFTSRYYFLRNGWSRKPGCRECNGLTDEEIDMTIDECVEKRHIQCTDPWFYIQFFCGSTDDCTELTTNEDKRKANEKAKYNILHNYYIVGILEQFEDTLNIFDRLMPTYFKQATKTWKSGFIQEKQAKTKTINKKEMSEKSKEYFRNGPLHYEIDLYDFAKKILNERMHRMGIEPVVVDE